MSVAQRLAQHLLWVAWLRARDGGVSELSGLSRNFLPVELARVRIGHFPDLP